MDLQFPNYTFFSTNIRKQTQNKYITLKCFLAGSLSYATIKNVFDAANIMMISMFGVVLLVYFAYSNYKPKVQYTI